MHEDARFAKQVRFILELDKEKTILRQTHLTGYRRQEMMRNTPGTWR